MSNHNPVQKPFGTYALKGYKKTFLNIAQKLDRSWLNFRLAMIMRKLVIQNKIQIIDAEIMGIKGRFYPLQNLGDRFILFLPQYFDYVEFELLAKYLKHDDVFLDIGANTGMYSLWALKFIKAKGNILSIEPNPKTFECLSYNIGLNDKKGVVVPLNIGVADKETSFQLYVDPNNLGGATIFDAPAHYQKVEIRCQDLKTILDSQQIKKVDAIKIDIEGAEALALNKFFEDAPKSLYPKLIIIESVENIDFLSLGYKFEGKLKSHNSIFKFIEDK